MKKLTFLFTVIAVFCQNLLGQEYKIFTIDAEFRPRLELRDGYQRLAQKGDEPAVFVSQRTRLAVDYKTERLRFRFVPADVRVWGDEQIANQTGVFGDHASLDLHEAYAEIRMKQFTWVSVGRQQLVYDNQALLSNRNWNQHGIASDAVVFKHNSAGWRMHLGGTWNSLKESRTDNLYPVTRLKTLSFIWLNKTINEHLRVSATHIATGVTVTDTTNTLRFRQTSGIYADYRKRYTSFSGNIYYQYGKNRLNKTVSAWLADADLSRRFGIMNAGIGMGYASGSSIFASDSNTDRNFYDIYRAKHKFYGFMDYFTDVSSATLGGGLVNVYLYGDLKLTDKLRLKNTIHSFSRSRATSPYDDYMNHLGFENDLVLSRRFSEWGVLEAGYMFFLPTSTMEMLQPGGQDYKFSQFGYIMLTLNPQLFRN